MAQSIKIKTRTSIKFILLKNNPEEIDNVVEKINSRYKKTIIITTMSYIFNSTLEILSKKNNFLSNVKIVGTLGSESKALNKIHEPSQVIRVFPPDYDEAKAAYNFFYSKLLSYICSTTGECQHSHKINKIQICCYHSQSYGAALNAKFNGYFNNYDDDAHDTIYPYSDLDTKTCKAYYPFDYDQDDIKFTLNKDEYSMYFIFIVGYEPNISDMLNKVFEEVENKKIDKEKVCFLLSPTYAVPEWKESILRTINNSIFKDTLHKFFYLKSIIPSAKFNFKDLSTTKKFIKKFNIHNGQGIEFGDVMMYADIMDCDFEEYVFEEDFLAKMKTLSVKPNYINIFAYTALRTAYKIKEEWKTNKNLHTIKYEAFKEVYDEQFNRPKIYDNGDSINHFVVRPLSNDLNDNKKEST